MITALLTIFSCVQAADSEAAYKEAEAGKAIIIDVREKNEIEEGMVKGAKWFPLSKVQNDANWLTEFKKMAGDKKIYLYCRSGGRSGKVQSLLKEKGVSADNLGGFMTLQNELPTNK